MFIYIQTSNLSNEHQQIKQESNSFFKEAEVRSNRDYKTNENVHKCRQKCTGFTIF